MTLSPQAQNSDVIVERHFAPIPAFVDTGSSLVDKSNVDAFLQASKSVTSGPK
jgi:hypothetical protein